MRWKHVTYALRYPASGKAADAFKNDVKSKLRLARVDRAIKCMGLQAYGLDGIAVFWTTSLSKWKNRDLASIIYHKLRICAFSE